MTAAPGAQPPPGWPGPGPSPLTQAGVLSTDAAWRRGAQQAAEDARGAVKPDITTPFQGFGDAAQRLTAFHVFGTEEGDEQDLDELATLPASDVLLSRGAQWQDMCVRKAAEFKGALRRNSEALEAYSRQRQSQAESGELRPEEEYVVARMVYEETMRRRQGGGRTQNGGGPS